VLSTLHMAVGHMPGLLSLRLVVLFLVQIAISQLLRVFSEFNPWPPSKISAEL
jgi:hypothetical protein